MLALICGSSVGRMHCYSHSGALWFTFPFQCISHGWLNSFHWARLLCNLRLITSPYLFLILQFFWGEGMWEYSLLIRQVNASSKCDGIPMEQFTGVVVRICPCMPVFDSREEWPCVTSQETWDHHFEQPSLLVLFPIHVLAPKPSPFPLSRHSLFFLLVSKLRPITTEKNNTLVKKHIFFSGHPSLSLCLHWNYTFSALEGKRTQSFFLLYVLLCHVWVIWSTLQEGLNTMGISLIHISKVCSEVAFVEFVIISWTTWFSWLPQHIEVLKSFFQYSWLGMFSWPVSCVDFDCFWLSAFAAFKSPFISTNMDWVGGCQMTCWKTGLNMPIWKGYRQTLCDRSSELMRDRTPTDSQFSGHCLFLCVSDTVLKK